jgi:hypothetical protein
VGLSAIRAATARNGLDDLDIFAIGADDQLPDVDDAVRVRERVVLVIVLLHGPPAG